jgi:hypothetical protein
MKVSTFCELVDQLPVIPETPQGKQYIGFFELLLNLLKGW